MVSAFDGFYPRLYRADSRGALGFGTIHMSAVFCNSGHRCILLCCQLRHAAYDYAEIKGITRIQEFVGIDWS